MVRGERDLKLAYHQILKPRRREEIDLVGPGEQVPGQLQHAAGPEAHQHRSVRLLRDLLIGMETPSQSVRRAVGLDAQDDILRIAMEDPEGAAGEFRQAETLGSRRR